MELNEYQRGALSTAMEKSVPEMIRYCTLGLCGEAGEVAEHIKKWFYHGHVNNKDELKKELGDVLWYLAVMADAIGLTLEDVAEHNLAKLANRYPEGFSEERSKNREES